MLSKYLHPQNNVVFFPFVLFSINLCCWWLRHISVLVIRAFEFFKLNLAYSQYFLCIQIFYSLFFSWYIVGGKVWIYFVVFWIFLFSKVKRILHSQLMFKYLLSKPWHWIFLLYFMLNYLLILLPSINSSSFWYI